MGPDNLSLASLNRDTTFQVFNAGGPRLQNFRSAAQVGHAMRTWKVLNRSPKYSDLLYSLVMQERTWKVLTGLVFGINSILPGFIYFCTLPANLEENSRHIADPYCLL